MIQKLFFAGSGGQGVILMGQMTAYAAMYENKEVTFLPSYGPEMRGGTANCTVVISDKPVSCPLVYEADVVVAMNLPSMTRFESLVKPGGMPHPRQAYPHRHPGYPRARQRHRHGAGQQPGRQHGHAGRRVPHRRHRRR